MKLIENIMNNKANWTQSGLLVVIIAMMGWFMLDLSTWKHSITDGLEKIEETINEHVIQELIKNQEQDINIIENQNNILNNDKKIKTLETDNKKIKQQLKMGL